MYDLKYCKLCLATDVRMSSMNSSILKVYTEFIRLPLFNHEPYVCYECEALLRKYQEFHSKCCRAHKVLTAITTGNSKITKETIQKINRKRYNLESRLIVSPTTVVNNDEDQPSENHGSIEEKYLIEEIKLEVEYEKEKKEMDDVKIQVTDSSENKNLYVISDNDSESSEHLPDYNNSLTAVAFNINVQNIVPKKEKTRKLPTRNKISKVKKKKDKITRIKVKKEKRTMDKSKQLSKISSDITSLKNESENDETLTVLNKYIKTQFNKEFNTSTFEEYATVKLLTLEEAKNEVLLRKESRNYICSAFKCDLCCKGFISKITFESHQKKHSSVFGTLDCEFCFLRFSSQRILTNHMRICHIRKFICKICSYACFNPSQAKAHIRLHKGKTHTCEDCGRQFNHVHSMLMHRRMNHAADRVCELCGSTFSTEQGLYLHKNKLHRQESNIELNGPNCEECGVQFATETAWKRHLVLSTKHKVSNGCEVCGEVFANKSVLRTHLKVHGVHYRHRKQFPVACHICNEWLASRSAYNAHMTSQHPQSGAARRIDPDRKGVDEDGQRFVCEVCGKEYKVRCLLLYHQRSHTGERPHKCDVCGKGFANPAMVNVHRAIHGPKRFQCDVCQKAFVRKGALKTHLKTHFGIRRHKCPICEKTFLFPSDIKPHIKYTHGKVPWPKGNGSKRRAKEPVF